jgi:hypothetical protein
VQTIFENITDISRLSAFERKILRKIYDPIKEGGECRIRYNKELHQLYKSPDIIISIKISRLRWAGHVERTNDEDILKGTMDCKSKRRRRVRSLMNR